MKLTKLDLIPLLILFYCCSLGGGTLNSTRTVGRALTLSRRVRQVSCLDGFEINSSSACDCGITETGLTSRSSGNAPGVSDAQLGTHPWHVGVHRTRSNYLQLICIGTLIHDDIVLTSANCVYDLESSLPYQASAIFISSGKLKRDFKVDEPLQQKFSAREIVILDRYEGDTKGYARNLAIIQLNTRINKNDFVRPICLWEKRYIPKENNEATISGWGLQFVGNYAMNLREASVKLHDISECVRRFYDPLYKRFLTNDKFCLTFDQGVGLKDIDTGGPVAIFHEGRHYLIGVLSLNRSGTAFGIATAVSKYINWIRKTINDIKKQDSCMQESHFTCGSQCISSKLVCNGQKDCQDGSDEDSSNCRDKGGGGSSDSTSCSIPDGREVFTPIRCADKGGCTSKYWAPSGSSYNVTCLNGFGFSKLHQKFVQMLCHDGQWFPSQSEYTCQHLCPGIIQKSLSLTCKYLGSVVPCDQPLNPNTVVEVSCKRFYKKNPSINFASQTVCRRDGSIEHVLSECTPVCGKPFHRSNVEVQISNGQEVKYAKYPWHIALYWKKQNSEDENDYEYKCGGTLIDSNKVLTAAHCIWDASTNKAVRADILAVASGKLHSRWWHRDDLEQKVGVSVVIPGEYYNGAKTKHSQDIAVLILSKELQLSDYTMPACLDLDLSAGGIPKGQAGLVVGWGRLSESATSHSETLMETRMEYLELDACRTKFNKLSFDEYLLSDKFCVLYKNGSGTQTGDSGGGMTFTHDGLHYVYGIVSIKKSGQNEFAAFTNVTTHKAWLKQILSVRH